MKRIGVVVSLLAAGCAGVPDAALSPAPADSFVRHFPEGLGAPALVGTGVVDGRRLAVHRARPAAVGQLSQLRWKVHFQGRPVPDALDPAGDPLDAFDELRDADTGSVLLPLDGHKIIVIPGVAVYVLPAERRAAGGSWARYDVKSGITTPSDVRLILQKGRSWLLLKSGGAEAVAKSGERLGRYEGVEPTLRAASPYHLLSAGGVDYLLGESLELLTALPDPARAIGPFFARRAPGTSELDELYVILQKDGRFAAPPGVWGLRPLPDGTWLARFARPGEPGYVEGTPAPLYLWGSADRDLRELSRPRWMSADLVRPFGDARPLRVTSDGARWTAERVGAEGRAEGASEAEAVGALLARGPEGRERIRTAWRDALELNDAAALAALAWELGGDAWYDAAVRTRAPSAERLEAAAARVKGAGLSEELRRRARRRREELEREDLVRRHAAESETLKRLRAADAAPAGPRQLEHRGARASAWDPLR